MNKDVRGRFLPGTHWRPVQAFRHREWLEREYVEAGRSTGDIAREFGVTDAAVLFWLRKHGIPRRSIAEARALKRWGMSGSDNPMWNRTGNDNPNWRGGGTPERQSFYVSRAWIAVCRVVWKRDDETCQRCGIRRVSRQDKSFHIHHIESFANKERRADATNLVVLCRDCHRFVHSTENIDRQFLTERR
jgi:hypothetical protein